jgi:hypothetical protein
VDSTHSSNLSNYPEKHNNAAAVIPPDALYAVSEKRQQSHVIMNSNYSHDAVFNDSKVKRNSQVAKAEESFV